jgi:SAM-dependent methyltransferase
VKAAILGRPRGFELYQLLVGAPRSKERFVREHVRARPGNRVLDVGCGTGELLKWLPAGVDYLGVDIDRGYIDRARAKHGDRAKFVCADISSHSYERDSYDVAIGYGILHHLDDTTCRDALARIVLALRRDGKAVFGELCRAPGQGFVERKLLDHDRGRHIRTVPQYIDLLRGDFVNVSAELLHGTYRIPLTLVALHATQRQVTNSSVR